MLTHSSLFETQRRSHSFPLVIRPGNSSNQEGAIDAGFKSLAENASPAAPLLSLRGVMELVPLPVGQNCDSDRHEHGGDDQNEDAAAQPLDDARPGRGRLGVAERTTLRLRDAAQGKNRRARKCKPEGAAEPVMRGHSHLVAHLANGFMCNRRKLSDQIMFIMSITKIVAGMRARRRLRRSWRRCMKYMTPRPA